MEEINYNEEENEQQNEMFYNNDSQEIKNDQESIKDLEEPKTMIQKIYKKIPGIFSWGFSCNKNIYIIYDYSHSFCRSTSVSSTS